MERILAWVAAVGPEADQACRAAALPTMTNLESGVEDLPYVERSACVNLEKFFNRAGASLDSVSNRISRHPDHLG